MSAPLVSVLIPCYNVEKYIGETLDSVGRQTWPNIEIIIVDDGSQDKSVREIEHFRGRRLRLLRQRNRGASAARNVAIAASSGDYVQFLDADDILHEEKIEVQVARLQTLPARTVASCQWASFRDNPRDAKFRQEPVWGDMSGKEFLIRSWNGGGMMAPLAWMTPRSVIEAAGPWDETLSLNDDGEYFTRVVLASRGITFCHNAMGYYRASPLPSLSKRRDLKAMESGYKSIVLSCAALLRADCSKEARRACATQFQRFAYNAYLSASSLTRAAEHDARILGGTDFRCPGGPVFQRLSTIIGWKTALKLQQVAYRFNRRFK